MWNSHSKFPIQKRVNVKIYKLIIIIGIGLIVNACAVQGDVVKVTDVSEVQYKGFGETARARLEDIRKAKQQKKEDSKLGGVIRQTPHFTVSQYLEQKTAVPGESVEGYKVGGYDVLNIDVFEEQDLSQKAVRVAADGYISFPLIGRLKVLNRTPAEIEKLIAQKLAEEQYLKEAHVAVMVTEYKSKQFMVLGAVKKPGSYALQAQERLLDAVSKAGGVRMATQRQEEQAGHKCMLLRIEAQTAARQERKIVIDINLRDLLNGDAPESNILLADKDVVYIPTAEHFYIIGEVKQPGSFTLANRDITLVEAISLAGGFTPLASRSRTRIIRSEDGVEKIIEVNVDAITDSGQKIHDVVIQPDDVIVVPLSFF